MRIATERNGRIVKLLAQAPIGLKQTSKRPLEIIYIKNFNVSIETSCFYFIIFFVVNIN